jgi:hypothetical protein
MLIGRRNFIEDSTSDYTKHHRTMIRIGVDEIEGLDLREDFGVAASTSKSHKGEGIIIGVFRAGQSDRFAFDAQLFHSGFERCGI